MSWQQAGPAAPTGLTVGHRRLPADLAADRPPSFGWWTGPTRLAGFRIQVADDPAFSLLRWDSGQEPSATEAGVGYGGPPLAECRRYFWRVRSHDDTGRLSPWSEVAWFGTAPGTAWAVAVPIWADPSEAWAFLRTEVRLRDGEPPTWATLFATAASPEPSRQYIYRLWLNDTFVGLGPTRSVADETRFDGFDVTQLLRGRELNAIAAQAWAATGRQFLALLAVGYHDGIVETIGTDDRWQALDGVAALPDAGSIGTSYFVAPVEDIKVAAFPSGFARSGFDDAHWPPACVREALPDLRPTPTAKVEIAPREPVTLREVAPGHYVLDYGRTCVGGLRLRLAGCSGQRVELRFGEELAANGRVRYRLATGNTYRDTWTLSGRAEPLETWGVRVFRYVEVIGAPTGLTAADVPAIAQSYPLGTPRGQFACSDPDLAAVWRLARNTIEATSGNLCVDSWTREREPYEADLYLHLLAFRSLSADPTLLDYSLEYLLARRTWPTEWPWYLVLAARAAYQYSGDLAPLRRHFDRLLATLPIDWIDETGLIRKDFGCDGGDSHLDDDLVDWPPGERDGYVFSPYNTVVNSIACRAFGDLAEIATALDRPERRTLAATATRLRDAIRRLLFDAQVGAFRDGLDADGSPVDHHAQQASVFPAALGVATRDQTRRIADRLAVRGLAGSVYAAGFAVETLFRAGRPDAAVRLMTGPGLRSWRHMIDLGAGATMEAWDLALKPNASLSHPWGAVPAHLVVAGSLGIQPSAPGYARVVVRPQLGTLEWVRGRVPTVRGPIEVEVARTDDGLAIDLVVPGNTEPLVRVPGRHRIRVARG